MDFFCFSTCSFCSHFIGFGLRPSGSFLDWFFSFFDLPLFSHFIGFGLRPPGSGLDGCFFVFRLAASFPILLPLVKGRRVQALMDFFLFSTCSFFFQFIAFGFRPSGSSFDRFCLFFDLHLLFPFYCLCFKAVGFSLWRFFFLFWFVASFPILLALL